MSVYTGQTDQHTKVELPSTIQQVHWEKNMRACGCEVGLEVTTNFVGNGAGLEIKLTDHYGKKHGTIKGKIAGNRYRALIRIPEQASYALFADVKLPKHGLKLKSPPLLLVPPIRIKNAKWSSKEARRGDVLTLTADVNDVPDGTVATLSIMEHDDDGVHDLITTMSVLVKNKSVEIKWEYEYQEDTDEIPTKEESKKGYNPPEYFFRVTVHGIFADSGLLAFKDWVGITLITEDGDPIPDEEYLLTFADGQKRKGKVDEQGQAVEKDIPPGSVEVIFPKIEEKDWTV